MPINYEGIFLLFLAFIILCFAKTKIQIQLQDSQLNKEKSSKIDKNFNSVAKMAILEQQVIFLLLR